jgi:hypothetical protein
MVAVRSSRLVSCGEVALRKEENGAHMMILMTPWLDIQDAMAFMSLLRKVIIQAAHEHR